MWAYFGAYVEGMRDVLGLQLPVFEKYKAWENCSLHGSFRVLHEEFCIVSDFPAEIHKDEQNRPHNEHGPSHRWRDGWCLWHWHGVKVPKEWITEKSISAAEALNWPNIEQRRAACEIIGWARVLEELNAKVIDTDEDPEVGTLLEADIPDSGKERFLKVRCGTGRDNIVLPVPPTMNTALQANLWTYGIDDVKRVYMPEVRT